MTNFAFISHREKARNEKRALQAYIYRKAHADKAKETILAAEPTWKRDRALLRKAARQIVLRINAKKRHIASPFGEPSPEADVEGLRAFRIEYPLQAI
jgi:hypothetical protein